MTTESNQSRPAANASQAQFLDVITRDEATAPGGTAMPDAVRQQLRALIIEELEQLIKR